MWYIVSANGLKGIETYMNGRDAWLAAESRNSLVNQGWRPVRVA